jgi:hypothetical protein
MMRKVAAMLGLALACTCIRAPAAEPLDAYQLLMWQSRTPVQMEGLKRLGFTGTALIAGGGRIDPAALATRIGSGLPWYLENIATDFLAPYHRYTPGKPVTWLFDAAKARRRAEPTDPVRPGLAGRRRRPAHRARAQPGPIPSAVLQPGRRSWHR